MTAVSVRFSRNLSTALEIQHHLTACSGAFVPPLASRVVIPDYAVKLAALAERFEAWSDDAGLVGLVAVYLPRLPAAGVPPAPSTAGEAFITDVSVMPAFHRGGIARHLLAEAIEHCRGRAARITLKVDRRAVALHLYRAIGFVAEAEEGDTLTLGRSLI